NLLNEVKDFFRTSNDNERAILQKYVERYFYFFTFVLICHCLVVIAFSCGPIFLSTKFPLEVWYPFLTESPTVIYILYILHMHIIIKAGFNFIVNFTFAMFFMYSSARLEMLCLKIQNAKNKRQIILCIKDHQKII
ncbi:Odorant receptor 386, partial [Nylanderia fulva]